MAQAPPKALSEGRQGHYAGVVTRGAALATDLAAMWGIYALGVYAASLAWQLITGKGFSISHDQVAATVLLVVWSLVYFSYQWTVGGRTLGMALFGLRLVQKDGQPVTGRWAVLRALALHISLSFLLIGAVWILVQRQRRALHDLIAGTAVVYSWDARAARLRWLADRRAISSLPPHGPGQVVSEGPALGSVDITAAAADDH